MASATPWSTIWNWIAPKGRSSHCRVISYSQCLERLQRGRVKRPGMAAVISLLLREQRLRKIFVPANFPFGLARDLRNYKIKVRVRKGGIFPEREFKHADEIKKISAAPSWPKSGWRRASRR